MTSEPKRRRGRPIKPPVEGERVGVGFRITAELKRRLEEAAIKSGRSQSQECELRLEQSFERDDTQKQHDELKAELRKQADDITAYLATLATEVEGLRKKK